MQLIVKRRQSKSIPLIYGGLAGLLLIVIAAMALVLVPPSPPQVAEFAPQAQEQIDDSLDNQSSPFGEGGTGACAAGQVCEFMDPSSSASRTRAVVEKARVRRCVGTPPRQIEDPQSPQCVNYWEGENGGATSKGVTRDEIRFAYPAPSAEHVASISSYVEFFNRRFEFYGRKLVAQPVRQSQGRPERDPAYQRSFATRIDEELKVFGAGPWGPNVDGSSYYNELARRKIVSVGVRTTSSRTNSKTFLPYAPYQWNVYFAFDDMSERLGSFICSSLAGFSATHGGAEYQLSERKFGIMVERESDGSTKPDPSPLVEALSDCDVVPVIVEYQSMGEASTALFTLKSQSVTSVICLCIASALVRSRATESNYYPEWITSGVYTHEFSSSAPGDVQQSHTFGLFAPSKIVPLQDEPWYWARREVDPSFSGTSFFEDDDRYKSLLVLASGIQMAGPKLTPETFALGLQRSRFPNPGSGRPPYWQFGVGFSARDFSFISDHALTWWDDSAEDPYGVRGDYAYAGKGSWCFIHRGERFQTGQFPKGPLPFFDRTQPCR